MAIWKQTNGTVSGMSTGMRETLQICTDLLVMEARDVQASPNLIIREH